jgi:hypothetical protein
MVHPQQSLFLKRLLHHQAAPNLTWLYWIKCDLRTRKCSSQDIWWLW